MEVKDPLAVLRSLPYESCMSRRRYMNSVLRVGAGSFGPAGASTEVKDSEGRTPLIAACAAGHLEAVKALAGKGAAVEAVGKVG